MIMATSSSLTGTRIHPRRRSGTRFPESSIERPATCGPVLAVQRAAALIQGQEVLDVAKTLIQPLTYDMDQEGMTGPEGLDPVLPKVVPNPEVPDTTVVGKAETKVDAVKLAKGNPAFVDDIELRGMIYAKMLYSPHAHARIVSIDDSKARALPGVRAVLHHENVPRVRYASGGQSYPNPKPYDQVSFDNKVRYVGDRVAAVAADSLEIAAEAIGLIEVEYELLQAIFDEREAMKDGAPVIHDEEDMEGAHDASRNVVHQIKAEVGDIEEGFSEASRIFEQTFRVHQVQQTPIEPHIAIAYWDSDERMVIRTSTQFHSMFEDGVPPSRHPDQEDTNRKAPDWWWLWGSSRRC